MLRRCCAGGGGGKGDAIPGGEKLWELSLVPICSYVSLIYNVPKHENAISRYQDMGIAWYRDIVSPRPRFGYRDSIMGVTGALDRVSVKGACSCRQRCGDEGYVFCGLVVVYFFVGGFVCRVFVVAVFPCGFATIIIIIRIVMITRVSSDSYSFIIMTTIIV